MSNFPIYESTKQSFEVLESKIDSIDAEITKKVNNAVEKGRTFAKEEIAQIKAAFQKQVDACTEDVNRHVEGETSKLSQISSELAAAKAVYDALSSAPGANLGALASFCSKIAQEYTSKATKVQQQIADITMTTAYIPTAGGKLAAKIAALPNILSKIDKLPTK